MKHIFLNFFYSSIFEIILELLLFIFFFLVSLFLVSVIFSLVCFTLHHFWEIIDVFESFLNKFKGDSTSKHEKTRAESAAQDCKDSYQNKAN